MSNATPDTYQQPQPMHEHDDEHRRPRIISRLAHFVQGKVVEVATGDLHDEMSYHGVALRGYSETPIVEPDTLTGEPTEKTLIKFPKVPRSRHIHVPIYEHGFEANPNHDLFVDLVSGIEGKGSFKIAVNSYKTLMGVMQKATDLPKPGLARRAANKLAPADEKRDNYLLSMHENLHHEVYEAVMGVDYEPTLDADRDWSDVLNLRNIQVLRNRLLANWQSTNQSKIHSEALIRSGNMYDLNPLMFADYLGVSVHKLRQQLKSSENNNERVVPDVILNKLSFFIQFANDPCEGVPEDELSPALRLLHGSDVYNPNDTQSAIYRINMVGSSREAIGRQVDEQLSREGVLVLPAIPPSELDRQLRHDVQRSYLGESTERPKRPERTREKKQPDVPSEPKSSEPSAKTKSHDHASLAETQFKLLDDKEKAELIRISELLRTATQGLASDAEFDKKCAEIIYQELHITQNDSSFKMVSEVLGYAAEVSNQQKAAKSNKQTKSPQQYETLADQERREATNAAVVDYLSGTSRTGKRAGVPYASVEKNMMIYHLAEAGYSQEHIKDSLDSLVVSEMLKPYKKDDKQRYTVNAKRKQLIEFFKPE